MIKKTKTIKKWLFYSIIALSIYIIFDFLSFVRQIEQLKKPILPKRPYPFDTAIVILTGGKNRIQEGVQLFKKQLADRIFISGVHQTSNKTALAKSTNLDEKIFRQHVDLGLEAINTLGNARESAKWIDAHHYKTIYLVTSDYHIPRSLLEFRTLMPNIKFIPYPVPSNLQTTSLEKFYERYRILGLEYSKLLRERIKFALFRT